MSAALNSIIADWGFEDLNRDGLNELWLDVINLFKGILYENMLPWKTAN
jgi:hypothetical protein